MTELNPVGAVDLALVVEELEALEAPGWGWPEWTAVGTTIIAGGIVLT
ncbi:daptide-type RiPP [Streptomyces sp. NRRL WC-3742]|nr:daptide-type RiPP [Streptomyces sp. NRRL WC-3742]